MDSLTFRPGIARLVSLSPSGNWMLVFEDEGPTGYCYACDTRRGDGEDQILDSMLIYNSAAFEDRTQERIAGVQWSRDGQRAALYLDGIAQAFADFGARESFCRSNFPNFLDGPTDLWRNSSHAWNDDAFNRFEAEIYS
jgi:hypothetical protein